MSSGSEKRSQALAIRGAKLRRQGLSLSQVADHVGLPKDAIAARIKLGERLLSLEEKP